MATTRLEKFNSLLAIGSKGFESTRAQSRHLKSKNQIKFLIRRLNCTCPGYRFRLTSSSASCGEESNLRVIPRDLSAKGTRSKCLLIWTVCSLSTLIYSFNIVYLWVLFRIIVDDAKHKPQTYGRVMTVVQYTLFFRNIDRFEIPPSNDEGSKYDHIVNCERWQRMLHYSLSLVGAWLSVDNDGPERCSRLI